MDRPKVSVLVSTFNCASHVERTLESALRQRTTFPFEIVVGDDGSKDGTRDILSEIERRHPGRIRLFFPEKNLGAAGGEMFLALLRHGCGELLAMLDGDDEWTSPFKLQRQADFLDAHPECVLSFHNALVGSHPDDPQAWPLRGEPADAVFGVNDLLGNSSIQNSTLMLRRELADPAVGWLTPLPADELVDWSMAVLAARHGKVGYLAEVLSLYRQQSDGIWSKRKRTSQLEEAIRRYDVLRPHLGSDTDRAFCEAIGAHSMELAIEYERQGAFSRAADALTRCIAERPAAVEAYLPGEGHYGAGVWRLLARRALLYRIPGAGRVVRGCRRRVSTWSWHRLRRRILAADEGRRKEGQRTGTLVVEPSAGKSRLRGFANHTLQWVTTGTEAIEIRIGAPGGPLFMREGPNGSLETGDFVHDGMLFFLQDASPGSQDATLAVARARLPAAVSGAPEPQPADAHAADPGRGDVKPVDPASELRRAEITGLVEAVAGKPVTSLRHVPTETDCVVWEAAFEGGAVFVKAGRTQSTSAVALEAWVLQRAAEAGVPVSRVLAIDTERRGFPTDVMVLERVTGQPLTTLRLSPDQDRMAVREVGRSLRKLHGIRLEGFGTLNESLFRATGEVRGVFPSWYDAVAWHVDTNLEPLVAQGLISAGAAGPFRDLLARHAGWLQSFDDPRLLHGDLCWDHVFVSTERDTPVVSLIDFGNRQAGDPSWEFARLTITEGEDRLDELLAGYDQAGDVGKIVRERIPLYRVVFSLTIARWFHERGYAADAGAIMSRAASETAALAGAS